MTNDTAEITVTADSDTTDAIEADTPEPMRILKIATCPSLSERSELTYHVGCNESGAIHFRLWANTSAGMFNNIWFSMGAVSGLLVVIDGITSTTLQPLWESTSRNNAGFTLAILKSEGLIVKSLATPRTYCTVSPEPFLKHINSLIASGVDLPESGMPEGEPSVTEPIAAKRGRPKKA